MNPEIKRFDTPGELAKAFAVEFQKVCRDTISERGNIDIAISGGNTPKELFRLLAENYKNTIEWEKVSLYWVDERCVAANDDESNFGMTWKILIDKVNFNGNNVHRVYGDFDPEEEAKRYSDDIVKSVASINGFPAFGMTLLGIGDDGHTASIFPGQLDLFDTDEIAVVSVKPETGQKRITLTGKVINNSERIFFLAAGKTKQDIIDKILNKKDDYLKYPAAHVEPLNGDLSWYIG